MHSTKRSHSRPTGPAHRPPPVLDVTRPVNSAIVSPGRSERYAGLQCAAGVVSPYPSHTLRDPKSLYACARREVLVKIKGKKVADVKGVKRIKKGITLKKLPSGAYKISVLAITVLNQRLSGSKTYHSCTKSSGAIKLHGGK